MVIDGSGTEVASGIICLPLSASLPLCLASTASRSCQVPVRTFLFSLTNLFSDSHSGMLSLFFCRIVFRTPYRKRIAGVTNERLMATDAIGLIKGAEVSRRRDWSMIKVTRLVRRTTMLVHRGRKCGHSSKTGSIPNALTVKNLWLRLWSYVMIVQQSRLMLELSIRSLEH